MILHFIPQATVSRISIEFENSGDVDCILKSIESEEDEYISINHSNNVITKNSINIVLVELTYAKLIDDISQRPHSKNIQLSFEFDISNNPKTDDILPPYIIILAISVFILMLSMRRNKRGLHIIAAAIIVASLSVQFVSANSFNNSLTIEANIDLASILEVNYGPKNEIGEVILAQYGSKIELPIPEKDDSLFLMWIDDRGHQFDGYVYEDLNLVAVFDDEDYGIIDIADRHNSFEINDYGYWSSVFRSTSWQHNPGAFGNCTWFAWYWRRNNMEEEYWLPTGAIGNARSWISSLGDSYQTGRTPAYGAIMQSTGGRYGHVAVVVDVIEGEYITIQEMNYKGYNRVFQSTINWSDAINYNYIYGHK